MFGDGCPVGWAELVVGLDRDVSIGDAGEGGCDAEVVDEPLPCRVVAVGVVEVVFEPVGLVAPDGSPGGPGGGRSEDVEVELGGMVGELLDAVDAGEVEGGVELADVVAECVTLVLRWLRARLREPSGGGRGRRGAVGLSSRCFACRRGVGGRRGLRWCSR